MSGLERAVIVARVFIIPLYLGVLLNVTSLPYMLFLSTLVDFDTAGEMNFQTLVPSPHHSHEPGKSPSPPTNYRSFPNTGWKNNRHLTVAFQSWCNATYSAITSRDFQQFTMVGAVQYSSGDSQLELWW